MTLAACPPLARAAEELRTCEGRPAPAARRSALGLTHERNPPRRAAATGAAAPTRLLFFHSKEEAMRLDLLFSAVRNRNDRAARRTKPSPRCARLALEGLE